MYFLNINPPNKVHLLYIVDVLFAPCRKYAYYNINGLLKKRCTMNIKLEDLSKEELLEYVKKIHEDKNEKYGLVWDREKEPEQIVVDCDKYIPILVSEE